MAMPPAPQYPPHPQRGAAGGRPRRPWGRYLGTAAAVAAVLVAIGVVRIIAAREDPEDLRTSDGVVYERTVDEDTVTILGPPGLSGALLDESGRCLGGHASYLDLDAMKVTSNQADLVDADLPPSVTIAYARCDAPGGSGQARDDRNGWRTVAGRAVAGVVGGGEPSVEQCRAAARQQTIPAHVTADMLRSDPRFAKDQGWCFETVGKTVVHLKVLTVVDADTRAHYPAFAFLATQWKPRPDAAN